MARLRLGTVPYLNARPLIEGLGAREDVTLVSKVPARLVQSLHAGEVDAALVSAVELFRDPALSWIPGPGVTSAGAVRSIRLYLRTPPAEVRTLALDPASRSANAMARVCLEHFLGASPRRLVESSPEALPDAIDADAVLRIGDAALLLPPGGRRVLDLGEIWTKHTGLPFVYAVWITREDTPAEPLTGRLLEARAHGLARRAEIATAFAAEHRLPSAECEDYLTHAIGYDVGAHEVEGLRLFGTLAHELGLVPSPTLPAPLGAARPA